MLASYSWSAVNLTNLLPVTAEPFYLLTPAMRVSIYDLGMYCSRTPTVAVMLVAPDPDVISKENKTPPAASCRRSVVFIGCCVEIHPGTAVLVFLMSYTWIESETTFLFLLFFFLFLTDTGANGGRA